MTTGYSSGMRDKRITILNRKEAEVGDYGIDSTGIDYEETSEVWASVSWVKGMRAMNEGAIDVYGIVMVRMNYTDKITARSRIRYNDDVYQILPETFHADKQRNTIQFNAQAIIGEDESESSE